MSEFNAVQEQILMKQLATALLDGSPISAAAKAVGIPLSLARRMAKSEEFKALVSSAADDTLAPALAEAKAKLGKLVSKAIKVIDYQLDENNLDAAKIVLKAVGLDQQEEKVEQDTTIQVILPSGTGEARNVDSTTIEVS